MQGLRNNFEDAHFLDQQLRACGVFDGHLGDEAAEFCAQRLHLHVQAALAAGHREAAALPAAFLSCDQELRQALPAGCEAGTTATFALVREDGSPERLKVFAACAGDSRALLWRKDTGTIEATKDHRPGDEDERRRIVAAGGFVADDFDPPRVDGKLACSRALGAFAFKQDASLPAGAQKVSSVPEVYEWEASPGDWLILGCDGIWDTLRNEQVVDAVCKTNHGSDLGDVLAKTLSFAISKEADDNLSLLAVELGPAPDAEPSVTVLPGDFLRAKGELPEHYQSFCRRVGFSLSKEARPKAPPVVAVNPVPVEPSPFAGLPQPVLPPVAPPSEGAATVPDAVADTVAAGTPAPEALPVEAVATAPATSSASPAPLSPAPPLVIVGPSGVGKGTLISKIVEAYAHHVGFSVSHTTRLPRPGEVDGKHYHFVSLEDMKAQIEAKQFIEHAVVHSNLYGTSIAAIEKVRSEGKICILDIDVQGARQIKQHGGIDARFLFIAPPSLEELERRLRGRGTETEEKIQLRLANAREEVKTPEEPGFYDEVLVNSTLEAAERQLRRLLRRWYPMLAQPIKVTAQRSPGFCVRAARELVAGLDGSNGSGAPDLEVLALGNAIPAAALVACALQEDGHELVEVETGLTEVAGQQQRKSQVPNIAIVLRRARRHA